MYKNVLKVVVFLGAIPFLSGIISSCGGGSTFPIEPEITMVGISKDTLAQSFLNTDSLIIEIDFKDGDGDLGSAVAPNFFVRDSRDGTVLESKMNELPIHGDKGISGTIRFTNYTTCCIYPDNTPPCTASSTFPTDQLVYTIWLVDREGHKSNEIQTPPIYIDCTK